MTKLKTNSNLLLIAQDWMIPERLKIYFANFGVNIKEVDRIPVSQVIPFSIIFSHIGYFVNMALFPTISIATLNQQRLSTRRLSFDYSLLVMHHNHLSSITWTCSEH